MTDGDIDDRAARRSRATQDGRYRGLASLSIPGDIIGPFRYYGTRKDDPNDIVEHQKRRDLRGLFVFAAWLNHTDTKSINSLDSVVEERRTPLRQAFPDRFRRDSGQRQLRGQRARGRDTSTLSTSSRAAWQFLSLGLYRARMDARRLSRTSARSGHLEYETFDPEHWRNNYPNPAFDLRTPGDTYWAAKKVMAISRRGDPRDRRDRRSTAIRGRWTGWRACLIERRNKIGRAFLDDVLPLDDFAVRGGKLVFEDLAVKLWFPRPREAYSVRWSEFDN